MSNYSRICHVITGDLWGGAENQVYTLINKLNQTTNNFNLSVITFSRGLLYKRLIQKKINVHVIDEAIYNPIQIFFNIMNYFKINNIEIIHTHGFKENFISGLVAKLLGIKRVIRTHHGKGMVGSKKKINAMIEIINAKMLSHKLISVSTDLKKYLVHHLGCKNKIHVIVNGIENSCEYLPDDHSYLIDTFLIKKGAFRIGTVGRIVSIKGHFYLIESIKRLKDAGYDVCCILVGDGPLLEELKVLTKNLGLEDQIIFLGFVKNPFSVLSMFDIFVLPSLHEGIPMVLLEAMLLKRPIIASNVGGIPEVVTNGHDCLLVPSKNSLSIFKAIKRLIHNKKLRNDIANNAYQRVTDNFLLETTLYKTLKLYF